MRKLTAILLTTAALALAQEQEPPTGLRVTFAAGEATDTLATPNIALYVPEGQPATPFLPPGRFTATWEGAVKIDLRGDYSFQATGRGSIKLEVNNAVLLDLPGLGGFGKPVTTKTVRLNKGDNSIRVTYTSPNRADAQFRLTWSERPDKPMPHEPIRAGQLTHEANPALSQAQLRRAGRELFLESRCIRCHAGAGLGGILELAMSGPSFANIGDRRRADWMTHWMLNPKAHRADARMPRLLIGKTAKADAEAIASYLATLKAKPATEGPEPNLKAGEELVGQLNCAGCHNLPGAKEPAKNKLTLDHLNAKFPDGQLRDFLRAPDAHFKWTRMPKFNLSAEEASNVASWLRSKAAAHEEPKAGAGNAGELARGKELLSTTGCLNCHSLKDANQFRAPDLATLTPDKWTTGCLADKPVAGSRPPRYDFTASERAALRAFATTDRQSLLRHVPAEFAPRQLRLLNCNACHGELEGFPALDLIGAKLKPEWTTQLFAGQLKQRPRPWLVHRMPAFPARAAPLAQGLAMGQGLPPASPKPPPVNAQLAEIGRKLVGVDGGFSCVACHGVKNREPLQVFEAQGVNFASVGARMQPDFLLRWILDPLRVDPQSRMPDYFDEDGRSVLVDVLEGDAKKQIEAIRQYLQQGNKMKLPVFQ
jgi:mono/diheme cytochrome c family protein